MLLQQAIRDLVREHGRKSALMLSPVLDDVRVQTRVPGDERLQVLDFTDPRKYPALYDPTNRYDNQHMTYDGAKVFSRTLADAFFELLQKHED